MPSGEILGLNALFHSSDWSIVGIGEFTVVGATGTGAVAGFDSTGGFCCANAGNAAPNTTTVSANKNFLRMKFLRLFLVSVLAQFLRFQRIKPTKRPTPTSARPTYMCHP